MGNATIGRVRTAVLSGVRATLVTVEVHRGDGLPRQTLVGLPGGAVRESLDRIHAACAHSELAMRPRRTTINLAPAGVPKSGAGLDLPIALAMLAAEGLEANGRLAGTVVVGELGLDGRVRPVNGVLPMALAARAAGLHELLVPAENAAEAGAVPGVQVRPVPTLAAAAAHARGDEVSAPARPAAAPAPAPADSELDLSEIQGLTTARRALEIAAAGSHHLLLTGPPGTGKTLLARALPGLLPELTFAEALEASSVHSVVGALHGRGLLRHRPFRAPHHTISSAGLVGGGTPLRPGEISLATHGVLFLDELPEFRRQALECLRQPLEAGSVSLVRANESHEFPARFQLVAAMNECPCGRGAGDDLCACGPGEVERYRRRASGPLLDRIDLFVQVARTPLGDLQRPAAAEPSAAVRERVVAARALQRARCEHRRLADVPNARLPGGQLLRIIDAAPGVLGMAARTGERLRLSARAWHRMLRVARTCADLEGSAQVAERHVLEALRFRQS